MKWIHFLIFAVILFKTYNCYLLYFWFLWNFILYLVIFIMFKMFLSKIWGIMAFSWAADVLFHLFFQILLFKKYDKMLFIFFIYVQSMYVYIPFWDASYIFLISFVDSKVKLFYAIMHHSHIYIYFFKFKCLGFFFTSIFFNF